MNNTLNQEIKQKLVELGGGYQLTQPFHKIGKYLCGRVESGLKFYPEIYVDDDGTPRLQTTSYGALSVTETNEFIQGMNEGVKVLNYLDSLKQEFKELK